jgi:tRNA pseudouridine38-40 synthase
MNKAVSILLNSDINIMGAGRTDTGVHAKVMYAHFINFETPFDIKSLHTTPNLLAQRLICF